MRHDPTDVPGGSAPSAAVVFTLTFPFSRGEEFLQTEIQHLLECFDKVIIVPTLLDPGMVQTHEISPRVQLIAPVRSKLALLAGFCLRHPIAAVQSVVRALGGGRDRQAAWADLRFDLYASALARMVAPGVAEAIGPAVDVVFYGFWLHVPARVALDVRRLTRRDEHPVVSRANGFDLYLERHPRAYLPQRQLLLSGLQKVFAASPSAQEYLEEHYPEHVGKFTSDRIGTPPPINPGNARRAAFHIVSCSYLAPVKRLTMLIDDIAAAQRALSVPLTWTHIGAGAGAYAEDVYAHAARALTPSTYQFLGHMENHELREWYARNPASVFVQVSESEGGLAASIQEGLAQGLPVIVTAVGGVSALKEAPDIFDGLLERDHTPEQFAEKLGRLLDSDDETYNGYVAASMAYWSAHCSTDVLAHAFARRLRRISAERIDTPGVSMLG